MYELVEYTRFFGDWEKTKTLKSGSFLYLNIYKWFITSTWEAGPRLYWKWEIERII